MKRRLLLGVLAVLALGGCKKEPVRVMAVHIQETAVIEVGEKFVPAVAFSPPDADIPKLSWVAEDPEIVAVDLATGEFTGLKVGTTRIAVIVRDVSDACEVTVEPDILPTIPDPVFKAECLRLGDANGNGKLSPTEAASVTEMVLESMGIASLEGIGNFPNLTRLDCTDNSLTEIDLSSNPDLTQLICADNLLTGLDVSKNHKLSYIWAIGNPGLNGTFVVLVSSQSPGGGRAGNWEYNGETITADYRRVD